MSWLPTLACLYIFAMELKIPRKIYCCIIIASPNLFHIPISKGSLLNSHSHKKSTEIDLISYWPAEMSMKKCAAELIILCRRTDKQK